ncbi:MAG: DNA repair protein RecN [Gemmatimonadota bacterium]|nr:MAG: DNA repair protein RecN [Gemmatimonadota bacterium]
MLIELRIQDYAVIDDLSLDVAPGLNALSGETGAGKSIIVGALSLLLGGRASSEVVRTGASKASVEAVFDVSAEPSVRQHLETMGLEAEDGLLILRREVAAEGRNRAWINGSPVTARAVGDLGRGLVSLHGQHEHQNLLRRAEQCGILDAFAGVEDVAGEVRRLHGEHQELMAGLELREAKRREVAAREDFLRFQLGEIQEADLAPDEDEALKTEAQRLEHAEELVREAEALHQALYGGESALSDQLSDLGGVLQRLAAIDPVLQSAASELESAYHAVSEVGQRLGDFAGEVEHDPGRLEALRARQDLLFRLMRKYGPELGDVISSGESLRAELAQLDGAGVELDEIRAGIAEVEEALKKQATMLTEARASAAAELQNAIQKNLPDLGMPEAEFRVDVTPLEDISAAGAESVEFLVSLNAGFEPKPLARVASGGELSRVMLAVKAVLAGVDRVPTLVFDEIDAGIGGVIATKVGEKLSDVARDHQVFVITHLPQIASRASHHVLVEKLEREGVVAARVGELDGEGRIREIARMLGGDPESSTSRDHARELLHAP